MDLEATVEALAPLIRGHADAADQQRRYPPEVMHAFADAGLFRLMVPCAAGGLEADPLTVLDVVEAISRIDGSAGWLSMIGSGAGFLGGFLPVDLAQQIFSDPRACMAGNLGAPLAHATSVPGGYRVTGRWPFVSACEYATWLGGATVLDDGSPRIMVFPQSAGVILDTWSVTGLRATGSHDVAVDDLFVPRGHSFWWADGPRQPGPLYRVRFMILTHAAHALGVAQAAIDAFTQLALHKTPTRTTALLADRPLAQAQLAQAEALVLSAREFVHGVTTEVWQTLCDGGHVTPRQRALLRLAMTQAVQASAHAIDLLWAAAGGSPIYVSSPLERCFRDIHVATQHAAVGLLSWETIGKALLYPSDAEYLI